METRHRLKKAIDELLDQSLALHVAMDRHFASGFRQTVNGYAVDRVTFMAGIASLRLQVSDFRVTVLDEVVNGQLYAQRHSFALQLHDGTRLAREVYVFADLDAELRFARIDEVTVDIA